MPNIRLGELYLLKIYNIIYTVCESLYVFRITEECLICEKTVTVSIVVCLLIIVGFREKGKGCGVSIGYRIEDRRF